ncbi:type II toxin-antitoxin system RelE/ParE family toxin [Mesorhizobium sp.]|uniref:type II toxin-antitoxin system RelE/ParE family toxin n=1 Tax=Mesorhizobium sp. TaxID=1871066 RepID=UPI0025C1C843|nr:type II toxin-antitoxin system RelE/ParE family toxin [Mesorhizobium sp.]
MKYRLLPQATVDLESIGDYIASHDPRAAVRFVDALERRWDLLTLHPVSGAPRDDIAPVFVTWSSATTSPCTESVPMPSKSSVCCMVGERSRSMISIPDGSLNR